MEYKLSTAIAEDRFNDHRAISYDKDDIKRTNIHRSQYFTSDNNSLHKAPNIHIQRKQLNNFGVKVTKQAVIYHGFFFRNLCGKDRFYQEFNVCKKNKTAVINCLTLLSERGLLGRREILINGAHGLGIRFLTGGLVYASVYHEIKAGCKKSQLIRRMKSCIHKNGKTSVCLTKLQQQGLIGPGEIFRRLVVYKIKKVKGTNLRTKGHLKAAIKHHRRPISLKFKNGRLIHGGKGYYGDEEHISHRIKSVDEYLRQLAKLASRHAKEKANSKTIYSNSMSSDGSQVHRTYVKTAKKTNRKQHLNDVKHTVDKISKESDENHGYGSSEE
ncbi:unnamed protein product [Mytilus edulis]|uniref:Uncharacterized protein n=1 Tax=Mytilus edulis TaxID=6550 RepID=A0A8S3V2E5_MYTED|nr:unnamed protein product [Mytilus edulis]